MVGTDESLKSVDEVQVAGRQEAQRRISRRMYFAVEDGRLLLKRLIAPSGCCEADNDYDTVPLLQRLPSRPGGAAGRPRYRG